MYDVHGRILWQSFQHPLDTLVPQQKLTLGMSLQSSSFFYTATMYPGGLVVSRYTAPGLAEPIPCRVISFMSTFARNFTEALVSPCSYLGSKDQAAAAAAAVILVDGSSETFTMQASCKEFNIPISGSAGSDLHVNYVRLDPDGELCPYHFDDYTDTDVNEETRGYLHLDAGSDETWLGDCLSPQVCGPYGICTPHSPSAADKQNKSICSCPNSSSNSSSSSSSSTPSLQIFLQIDPKNAAAGCKLALPLQCNAFAAQHQDLLEYKNTTLVSMLITGWNNNRRTLTECRAACISTCSCSAAFYDHGSSTCLLLPIGSVLSMIYIPGSSYSAFLKVPMYDQQGLVAPAFTSSITKQVTSASSHGINHKLPAKVVAPAAFMIIFVCLASYAYTRKMTMSSREEEALQESEIQAIKTALPGRFSWRELDVATSGLRTELGAGGFGSVYGGVLEDGRRVAVKKLKIEMQGHKQFLAEVVTMGSIGHVNIVRLLGFCSERSKRLLVYEYMENGSLDKWIYGHRTDQLASHMLSWEQRLAVAIGTARGLTYLHDECPHPILHLDIKPQNILLDAAFVPKVADFGLARLTDRAASMVVTGAKGTPGYIAPEWLLHQGATRKCDVYSFGKVLLELVAGRKITDSPEGEEVSAWDMPSWASELFAQGRIEELVDKRLKGAADMEQVTRMASVALWCIQDDPTARPEMAQLMKMLEGGVAVDSPPTMISSSS